ncbi:MAG TPA: OmpA family protein [Anaeromyxobacteraceae bacterium]|nr:OmpA family protein [Anaeromyxobacteraceae bacterium]
MTKLVSSRNLVALALVVALAGCQTAGKRTAIGAGAGALAGAGIGALVGGGKGAAIGAGVGALTGGSVGLYLDKQHKELEKVAETTRTEQGLLVNFKGEILFDTGSAVLKPTAIDQLTQVGDILAKYKDDRVKVMGYTDSTGSLRVNEELSQRRADAVRKVLLGRGVTEAQITALGMGPQNPIADNATADGRQRNRRVELVIDVPNPS